MDEMSTLRPLPSIYYPEFIAANQSDRADNVLEGSKQEHLDTVRRNIREFKASHGLDKVIVLWTANTERFCDILEGVNDTAENLLRSIKVLEIQYFVFMCPPDCGPSCLTLVSAGRGRDLSFQRLRHRKHPRGLLIHQWLSSEHLRAGTNISIA